MALTGFLAGFNEQQKADQALEESKQLSYWRVTESLMNLERIKDMIESRGILDGIFGAGQGLPPPGGTPGQRPVGGTPPQIGASGAGANISPKWAEPRDIVGPVPVGGDSEKGAPVGAGDPGMVLSPKWGERPVATPEERPGFSGPPVTMRDIAAPQQTQAQRAKQLEIADKYDQAAAAFARRDPARSAAFGNLASNIRARVQHEKSEQSVIDARDREAQGAALASITGPENYKEGWDEYLRRGGRPAEWYTGDWRRDRARVEQLANASMSANQQQQRQRDAERTHNTLVDSARRAEDAVGKAQRANEELERKRARDAAEQIDRDKRTKAIQDRLTLHARADDKDRRVAREEFGAYIAARPDAPRMDADTQAAVIGRAAIAAKKRLYEAAGDDASKDFTELVREEFDRILHPRTGEIQEGSRTFFPGGPELPGWAPGTNPWYIKPGTEGRYGNQLQPVPAPTPNPGAPGSPVPAIPPMGSPTQGPPVGAVFEGYRYNGGPGGRGNSANWTKMPDGTPDTWPPRGTQ